MKKVVVPDDIETLASPTVDAGLTVPRVRVATSLRLLKLPLGLLINCNVPLIKDGIHRVPNLEFQS